MGVRLASSGARPSLIMVSPARRARETATIVATKLGYPREFLQRENDLYLATPDDIVAVIGEQDDAFMDVVVVGHNPGLSELVNRLLPGQIENVPTSGLVGILLDIRSWGDLGNTTGELAHFEYPRILTDSL
jgi:phosphohistidine phosphatase